MSTVDWAGLLLLVTSEVPARPVGDLREEWIVRGYGALQQTPAWDFRAPERRCGRSRRPAGARTQEKLL